MLHELVIFLNAFVNAFLLGRQLYLDDHLQFLRQLLRHVFLDSPEQERPQNLMETIDDQKLFFFRQFHGFPFFVCHLLVSRRIGFAERLVEPFLEVLATRENSRKQKVEESPEFTEVVLERSSCKQNSVRRLVLLAQRHGKLGFEVFHAMALVDDNVLPHNFAKDGLVEHNVFVGRDENIEFFVFEHLREFGSL